MAESRIEHPLCFQGAAFRFPDEIMEDAAGSYYNLDDHEAIQSFIIMAKRAVQNAE